MSVCKLCGVEYSDKYKSCPLCEKGEEATAHHFITYSNLPSEVLNSHRSELRNQMWEMTAIVAFLMILFSLAIDLAGDGKISWSLYPVAAISTGWLLVTSLLKLQSHPALMIMMICLTILGLTAVIDYITGNLSWFLPLAVPIVLSATLLSIAILILIKSSRDRGFNIIGSLFSAISIQCVVIEVFTKLALGQHVSVRWSLIVAAALIPVAGVLFYMHYRMKRGRKLGSFFHI